MTTTWACANHDNPDLWFPGPGDKPLHALDTCRTCPARQACAKAALDLKPSHGIWAGININNSTTPIADLKAVAEGRTPSTPTLQHCKRGHPTTGPDADIRYQTTGGYECRRCSRQLQADRRNTRKKAS